MTDDERRLSAGTTLSIGTRVDGLLYISGMRVIAVLTMLLLAAACQSQMTTSSTSAATPEGAVRVDGQLLVLSDPSLRAACVRAATRGGFTVPCPRLVLAHRGAVGQACPLETYAPNQDCLEDSGEVNPNLPSRRDAFTYVETDPLYAQARHLFVIGVMTDSPLVPFRVGCLGTETTAPAPDIAGTTTTWVECPEGGDGMNSGHVLLRWTLNGVVYVVSLHGHTETNRQLELVIARNLEYVAP